MSHVSAQHTDLNYRPDIDGLRAVAVLVVVAFHYFPGWMPGGLVGVDIFFVISGFLISAIILKGIRLGRFSYLEFYIRRIKRIFPALMVVLAACLIFGWFALYDSEYKILGKYVAGGTAFITNFMLWQEAGYFDYEAQFKQLLHLWSLGIEEQFYLIWPLLLALLWKKTHTLLPLILSLLVVSFSLNLWFVASRPDAAFYLPATRFWELMIGAVLAYATQPAASMLAILPRQLRASWLTNDRFRRARSELSAGLGLSLIVCSLLFVNQSSPFPGSLALLPTSGAFFIIAAGPAAGVNRWLLSSRPLVFIGLISYPLYLWHWPLLSFGRFLGGDALGKAIRLILVAASIVLAWLTYRIIEKPIRSDHRPAGAFVLCAVAIAIGGAGLAIFAGNGLGWRAINAGRSSERTLLATGAALDAGLRESYRTTNCNSLAIGIFSKKPFCSSYGSVAQQTIVVWGDSFAWAWSPVFYEIGKELGLRVIVLSVANCPPLVETRMRGKFPFCSDFLTGQLLVDAIGKLKPIHIFLIGSWSLYTGLNQIEAQHPALMSDGTSVFDSQLAKTLHALPPETPLTIFRANPVLLNNLQRGVLRRLPLEPTAEQYASQDAEANRSIDVASNVRTNLTVFDPTSLLCEQSCRLVVNRTLMYYDRAHISAQGALLYRDILLRDFFETASGRTPATPTAVASNSPPY